MQLDPAPDTLGLGAPVLGPWFSTDVTLAAPGDHLAVTVTPDADVNLLPMATGVWSLRINTAAPRGLAHLRGTGAISPFADAAPVVTLELLPEVFVRLEALHNQLPSLLGATGIGTGQRRITPRTFALELPVPASTADLLNVLPEGLAESISAGTEAERLSLFGLEDITTNRARAAQRLMKPGTFSLLGQALTRDVMARLRSGQIYRLFAFCERGLPLDPGAVAAWWSWLALRDPDTGQEAGDDNLWADDLPEAQRRTATVANNLSAHIVNPHHGPVRSDVLTRLVNDDVTGAVRTRAEDATDALTVGPLGDVPDPDPAPGLVLALLPDGDYGTQVALWANGALDGLPRDFARIGALSRERMLTGRTRVDPGDSGAGDRAAELQRAASTRVRTFATQPGLLHTTLDATAAAMLGVFDGDGPTTLVAEAVEARWGTFTLPQDGGGADPLPDVDPPTALPDPTVQAVTGAGVLVAPANVVARDQSVLVTFTFADIALVGAWVRVWPQGLDLTTGDHVRLAGGAGRAYADTTSAADPTPVARVRCLVPLADGLLQPSSQPGLDVSVQTARGTRRFRDLRFDRPSPPGGTAVLAGAVSDDVVLAELGLLLTGGTLPAATLQPGVSAVVLSATPALLDLTSVPDDRWAPGVLLQRTAAGDQLLISPPPFKDQATGDDDDALAVLGADVTRRGRAWSVLEAGSPQPGMHRRETLTVRVPPAADGGVVPVAVLGSGSLLARRHERSPHRWGHAGVPADAEHHGVGVSLSHGAALEVAHLVRDWSTPALDDLWDAAGTADPELAALTGAGPQVAVLRTVAAGVEAGLALSALATLVGDHIPVTGSADDLLDGVGLPANINDTVQTLTRRLRALERRLVIGARGAREAADALVDAISRAEDLVWIESQAFDTLAPTAGPDVFAALTARLDANPNLAVVIALPRALDEGAPLEQRRVRDSRWWQAWRTLEGSIDTTTAALTRSERVARLVPGTGPARSLRISSTAVCIDGTWALVGSTHLGRRGLTHDSSLAVSVFDERAASEVAAFQRALIADRLSLPPAQVPRTGRGLAALVRALNQAGGHGRLAVPSIPQPDSDDPVLTEAAATGSSWTQADLYNPDGSPRAELVPLIDLLRLAVPGSASDFESKLAPEV